MKEFFRLGSRNFYSSLPDVISMEFNGGMVVEIALVESDQNGFLVLKRNGEGARLEFAF